MSCLDDFKINSRRKAVYQKVGQCEKEYGKQGKYRKQADVGHPENRHHFAQLGKSHGDFAFYLRCSPAVFAFGIVFWLSSPHQFFKRRRKPGSVYGHLGSGDAVCADGGCFCPH